MELTEQESIAHQEANWGQNIEDEPKEDQNQKADWANQEEEIIKEKMSDDEEGSFN